MYEVRDRNYTMQYLKSIVQGLRGFAKPNRVTVFVANDIE